jgi:hypothetical protein
MARITVSGDRLSVELTGWEPLWALKRRVDVPLASVVRVAAGPEHARRPRGLRLPGSYFPGVIAAGTYRGRGHSEFWSVRRPERAVVIDLHGAQYDRLIIQVDDPADTVRRIQRALPAS